MALRRRSLNQNVSCSKPFKSPMCRKSEAELDSCHTNDTVSTNSEDLHCVEKDASENVSPVEFPQKEAQELEKRKAEKRVADKRSELSELKQMHSRQQKCNRGELDSLAEKWKAAAIEALQRLVVALPEPQPSQEELLQHMGIPASLLGLDFGRSRRESSASADEGSVE